MGIQKIDLKSSDENWKEVSNFSAGINDGEGTIYLCPASSIENCSLDNSLPLFPESVGITKEDLTDNNSDIIYAKVLKYSSTLRYKEV